MKVADVLQLDELDVAIIALLRQSEFRGSSSCPPGPSSMMISLPPRILRGTAKPRNTYWTDLDDPGRNRARRGEAVADQLRGEAPFRDWVQSPEPANGQDRAQHARVPWVGCVSSSFSLPDDLDRRT